MSRETEKFIRRAYQVAEEKDIADRVSLFTDDGTSAGESIKVVHRGPREELGGEETRDAP